MSLAMSKQERETFLAETRVGIVSIPQEGRGPLTIPVWYEYEIGGDVRFATSDESYKARLLAKVDRISFCVHDDSLPYRYVSIEGPIILEPSDIERDVRGIARRYLGPEEADEHTERVKNIDTLRVRIQPERWFSADFGKLDKA